ncbi:hypothetical protein AB0903_06420 [Streptomyces sp. NPDC048389]|uniref:hypothetical protein n=1 Tax=Streptomyces sp. NPDC048389 TaxID=3154622 RepID=UPI003456EE87
MPRRVLPPPPPPADTGCWPDRETLLADRSRAMDELFRMSIAPQRLVLLWLVVAGFAVGWAVFCAALLAFEEGQDLFSHFFGAVLGFVGLACMVPTGLAVGFGVAHEAELRGRLRQWSALAHDAAGDARYGAPAMSLFWFLPSFLLGAYGLWLSTTALTGGAGRGGSLAGVVLPTGLGLILWLTGLLGVMKAVSHYRWALRLVSPPVLPSAARGGTHR